MTTQVLEVITQASVVEVILTPMLVGTVESGGIGGGAGLPPGGAEGQVLAKTAEGNAWSSFMDMQLWFENKLL